MSLNSSGKMSLIGNVTGESIASELSVSTTGTISLLDTTVRGLAGKPSGSVTMPTDFYGKIDTFLFNLATSTDVNLVVAATAAGWNGSAYLIVTVPVGVVISASVTSNYALTISGSFPKGLKLINNGSIIGKGGAGGAGVNGWSAGNMGTVAAPTNQVPDNRGAAGGPALLISSSVVIDNTNGIIGGGGGGGGGGGMGEWNGGVGTGGGGGGGGAGGISNIGGAAGVFGTSTAAGDGAGSQHGVTGSPGTATTGGAGGAGYYHAYGAGGWNYLTSSAAGGTGGGLGAAGATGGTGGGSSGGSVGGVGGAAGACLIGNTNITWIATGARYGTIA